MLESITFLAAATAETAGDSSLVGQFGIDLKLIAAQAVNFVVVAFLLWRFAFKPVMVTMDERQRKIAEGLQFAEESRSQLAETEKRHAEIVREANVQSQQILEEARGHARQFEDRMKAETAVQIEEMRKRAEAANEVERQKMLAEARREVSRLVVLASAKVLQREMGDEEKARYDQAAAREIAQLN
jgi:F-type H+-transporting ATPase subunit b